VTRTIATTVAPRALRSIKSGHPWVFDHSIRTQKHTPRAGDLAVVFDKKDRFVGIGLADPSSPIAIRMLHHGSPATIDAEFFAERIDTALALREPLTSSAHTTGYRLVNGENDRLPGLVVDQYSSVVVVKIYTAAWLPHLESVVNHLLTTRAPSAVVLRASRSAQALLPGHRTSVISGDLPQPTVEFTEHGLRFIADVLGGNKTGHFLDQRENRQRVRDLSNGASVLDVFSSTGGFSVFAAAGGARSVTAIDISSGALAAARNNMGANDRQPIDGFTTIRDDAFVAMTDLAKAGRTFDVVVVDPPSFAPKRADIERGLTAYRKLTRAAINLIAADGLLVQASCSSRITEEAFLTAIHDELGRSGRALGRIESFGHPLDHPVTFPEGRYLKAVFARIT
jgi:23S rRNA (cytosine1962-C5)-methyltransferase